MPFNHYRAMAGMAIEEQDKLDTGTTEWLSGYLYHCWQITCRDLAYVKFCEDHAYAFEYEYPQMLNKSILGEISSRQEAENIKSGYKTVTFSDFSKKKGFEQNAQTPANGMPEVGVEPTRRIAAEDFESSASTSFTTPALNIDYIKSEGLSIKLPQPTE